MQFIMKKSNLSYRGYINQSFKKNIPFLRTKGPKPPDMPKKNF